MKQLEQASAQDPFLIAEIGVNHEGDLSRAIDLVQAAAAAGVDAVKFQSYTASELARADSPAYWDLSKEPTATQRELFARFDQLQIDDYTTLQAEAVRSGVKFLSTPFDESWVRDLASLVEVWKVASADITNVPLLRAIAATEIPVIMSTGASTRDEIEAAIAILGDSLIALLHCVLNYPCPDEAANLATISALRRWFPGRIIGYSDHVAPASDSDVLAPFVACFVFGATVVEKHFTDDRTAQGNDHYHSWDADGVREFRAEVSRAAVLSGHEPDSDKSVDDQSEARRFARRSVTTRRAIAAGTVITAEQITTKRPAQGGIGAENWDLVVGRQVRVDLTADSAVRWEDLEEL